MGSLYTTLHILHRLPNHGCAVQYGATKIHLANGQLVYMNFNIRGIMAVGGCIKFTCSR